MIITKMATKQKQLVVVGDPDEPFANLSANCTICLSEDKSPFNCLVCHSAFPTKWNQWSPLDASKFHEFLESVKKCESSPRQLNWLMKELMENQDLSRLEVVLKLFPDLHELLNYDYDDYDGSYPYPYVYTFLYDVPSVHILKLFNKYGIRPSDIALWKFIFDNRDKRVLRWFCDVQNKPIGSWICNMVVDCSNKESLYFYDLPTLEWLHKSYRILPTLCFTRGQSDFFRIDVSRPFLDKLQNNQHRNRLLGICHAMAPLQLPAYVLLWITEWCVTGPMTHIEQIRLIERYYGSYRQLRLK